MKTSLVTESLLPGQAYQRIVVKEGLHVLEFGIVGPNDERWQVMAIAFTNEPTQEEIDNRTILAQPVLVANNLGQPIEVITAWFEALYGHN